MTDARPRSLSRGLAQDSDSPRTIIVIALKRSGHHAFIDWLLAHAPAPTVFLNNSRPGFEFRGGKQTALGKAADAEPATPVSVEAAVVMARDRATRRVILNYENRFVGNVLKRGWSSSAPESGVQRLVFLRDPLNNFASVVKRVRNGRYNARQAQLGKTALLFRDYASLMQDPERFGAHIGPVHFDDWLVSEDYREVLAARLRLAGNDLPEDTSEAGGGSSFGALAATPGARLSQLKRRWVEMAKDPLFLAFFCDPETVSACERFYAAKGEDEGIDNVRALAVTARQSAEIGSLHRRYMQIGPLRRRVLEMEETQSGIVRNVLRLLAR
jgi:hypothetical protein